MFSLGILTRSASQLRQMSSEQAVAIVHRASETEGQFECDLGEGQVAFVAYRVSKPASAGQPAVIDFYRTVTPPAARGKGIAEKLALEAFEWAENKVPPVQMTLSCSYLSDRVLPKHARFARLVATL